jgi:preprotein translocase subunit YajC
MFINTALAQAAANAVKVSTETATTGGMSDATRLLVQFALIIVIFYFLLLRPQQKRMKAHAQMLAGIEKDSRIVVNGLLGKVVKVENENELLVEFAENVRVKVLRAYVSQVLDEKNDRPDGAVNNSDNK